MAEALDMEGLACVKYGTGRTEILQDSEIRWAGMSRPRRKSDQRGRVRRPNVMGHASEAKKKCSGGAFWRQLGLLGVAWKG